MKERIVIGADHLGLGLKMEIVSHLKNTGWDVTDIGTHSGEPVDYPDVAIELAGYIARNEFPRGILICGTGAGMAITASKVANVRAVAVTDPYTAERAIASNNAQVITLGALITGSAVAKMLVDIWLANHFQGGNSARKVGKIEGARTAM